VWAVIGAVLVTIAILVVAAERRRA
jgi:hypothetical protein